MTAENLHRARNGRVRYTGAATLPRATQHPRSVDDYRVSYDSTARTPTSSSTQQRQQQQHSGVYDRRATTAASVHKLNSANNANTMVKTSLQERISDDRGGGYHQHPQQRSQQQLYATRKEQAKSVDCGLRGGAGERQQMQQQQRGRGGGGELMGEDGMQRNKSKSSDNVFEQQPGLSLDSDTLKRMLNPLGGGGGGGSMHSSPDETAAELALKRRLMRKLTSEDSTSSFDRSRQHRSETGRRRSLERSMCLDLPDPADLQSSPPSDHFGLYDNRMYVTPPNSSNENSDQDRPYVSSGDEAPGPPGHQGGSPTGRLLLEYEMHLRNALARGLDAESYSLHTFEALLSQSMENVGKQHIDLFDC